MLLTLDPFLAARRISGVWRTGRDVLCPAFGPDPDEPAEGAVVMTFVKRSLSLKGHRTSLALEPEFWQVLDEIAELEQRSLAGLIDLIDSRRPAEQPLSSAARVHAIQHLRHRASAP